MEREREPANVHTFTYIHHVYFTQHGPYEIINFQRLAKLKIKTYNQIIDEGWLLIKPVCGGCMYVSVCLSVCPCSEAAGQWSTEGCDVIRSNATHTHCQCHHLTHFGILMSVTSPVVGTRHTQGHGTQADCRHRHSLALNCTGSTRRHS